jgi:glycosyltransferase involved in cell wall biosynthesis
VRLCYVANPNSIHVQRWVRYFADRGHEIHLINARSAPASPVPGVTLHQVRPFPLPRMRNLALGYAIRRLVRQIKPDLLHAHQVSPDGWLAAIAGFHPLLITAWGSDLLLGPHVGRRFRLLIRWALRQADYVTCVSENLAQAAQALGADPARLEVAPWGIDTEVFCPAEGSMDFRTRLGLGPGPVVLSVRAIRPVYNPLDIAQAVPHVLEHVPGAQFVVRTYTYDPDLLARFQTIIEEHNVAGSVCYVGDLPDDEAIADLYRIADIAVSVPSSDGAPLSVLEAMACGAVPVLSELASLREWVQDRRQGLFVPVGDVEGISAAIVRLLTDEPLRRELRANGLLMVRDRADSRVWMAHAERTYQKLCRSTSAS